MHIIGGSMRSNKFIVIVFFFILFGVLILYPINFLMAKLEFIDVISYSAKQPIYNESDSYVEKLLKNVKTSIDNKVINYFPAYSNINKIDKSVNSLFDKKIYFDLLNKTYYPAGKNSDGEYIYKNKEHYILQNNLPTDELDKRINEQISFFNNLNIDDINIFIPYRFEYTDIDNSIYFRNLNQYSNKFKKEINENISISEFSVKNIEEYLKYFYKTDHHYNMNGAYESYKTIMKMLNKKPKEAKIVGHDIKYYGSMARSSYSDEIYDSFYTLDVELPKHSVLVNKEKNENHKPKKILKNKHQFYDHYVGYFNGLFGSVDYDFYNPKEENLLIIQDSYGWQIDELIASHYNKTYVIDIRHDEYENGKFYIKQFMKKNKIKKVLFLYEAGSIFFDQYDYGFKDKVIS